MAFDPHLLDEIRSRIPVSAVVGRKVALKKKGREFSGLSPFKSEKTPSFFVNDQKGFYHCFASGEHGDIFTFLMKMEGLSFPEAVERLADEAGVPLPKPQPRNQKAADRRVRLYEAMEAAAAFFEGCLQRGVGRHAADYLKGRGVTGEVVAHFRIGYAPDGRHELSRVLKQKGFSERELIDAGLMIGGADIREPYDRFRNRVMFPIRDLKGRVIAFGGRALDPKQPAKYLNSPETPLFHKGNVLFNASGAREAAFKAEEVVVVEGYMDVVAMHQAGIAQCVAPLGTALTAEQLGLLWRMAPQPTLCFDGDRAGQEAAFRAVDTALPGLKPGYSIRFAFLPDGMDPDDVLRQRGPEALRKTLNQTEPLGDVLWRREWRKSDWETPETRALLEKRLQEAVERITDKAVRYHYQQAIKSKLYAAWRAARSGSGPHPARGERSPGQASGRPPGEMRGNATGGRFNGGNGAPLPGATQSLKGSKLVATSQAQAVGREETLLRLIVDHPWLLDDYAEDFAELPLSVAAMSRLRDAILDVFARIEGLDTQTMRDQLCNLGYQDCLTLVDRANALRPAHAANDENQNQAVEEIWRHVVFRHTAIRKLEGELADAERALEQSGSEADFERLVAIKQSLSSIDLT